MFSALRHSLATERSLPAIRQNLLAGITVGIIALPLSMALAIAVGVPPQHGLYTAIIAGIVIAATGGSSVNVSGPTAAFVVVLLPIVQQYGLGGLLLSGFMAGCILVLLGLARLGRVIEIVPYPVVIGFTAGIAVVIATLQLKDFLGLDIGALDGHFTDKVAQIIEALPSVNPWDLLVGGVSLTILLLWPRLQLRIPGHLAAILAGALLTWLINGWFDAPLVATIGSRFEYTIGGLSGHGIPAAAPAFTGLSGLPDALGEPTLPSFELVRQLMPSALTIAALGAIESLLCAVVADGMSGRRHDPNDELIGQGIGNMVAPLFGGIPATAAIARTAANVRAGGTSPLSAVVHGVFILAAMVYLAPLLGHIPMSAMAALLLVVAWNMSEARHFFRTARIAPRDDRLVLLTCFGLTVFFDMTIAVGVGMALAAILFIGRATVLTESRRIHRGHDDQPDIPESIALYDINGPLFFGSAQKALRSLTDVAPQVRVVILDMSEVSLLDMSALVVMESIAANLQRRGVALVINNLQPRMLLKLRRAGIRRRPGRVLFSRNLREAIGKGRELAAQT